METIVTPLFTFLGICVTAVCGVWIAYLKEKNKSLKESNKDLAQQNKDLSAGIVIDLLSFNDIVHKINNVFNQTPSDRFLILSAMNGKYDLRVCTVLYEQHNINGEPTATLSLGATGKFVNFKFDEAYLNMLKNIEKYGKPEYYITEKMEDCDLKRIYMAEKVKASKVFFLKRIKIDEENDRVFYCSYASHKDTYSDPDKMTLRIYTDQIKSIMDNLIKA
jgi:hypothetical protein